MKILNLYCGLGGNRKHWKGAKVTAVEYNEEIAAIYRDLYPNDTVVVGDAHEYLLRNYQDFDLIWSSPPCQSHSKMMKATRHDVRRFPDMKLYEEILLLQHFHKGKWVVENVKPYYEPLIEPSTILGRHCFWSNFPIGEYESPTMRNFIQAKKQDVKDWLGIRFDESKFTKRSFRLEQALRNCVHPKLGRHVFDELKKDIKGATARSKRTANKKPCAKNILAKQRRLGVARPKTKTTP